MDTRQIIETMGGRAAVIKLTGLTKGRISQWESTNKIPRPWLLLFHEMRPNEIPHPDHEDASSHSVQEPAHA